MKRLLVRIAVTLGAAAALGGALLQPACQKEGCLGGDLECVMPSPCGKVQFACEGGWVEVRVISAEDVGEKRIPGGLSAQGAIGDILLGNDRVQAVIEAIDHANYLAPSGGNLLDLATRGDDNDHLTHMFLATGILPGDAVRYEELKILETGDPGIAAVQLRGRLEGHRQARVYTRYEIRACEPGIRVRTELVNLGNEPALWPVLDTFYWSGRETWPFVPVKGIGFEQPALDLVRVGELMVPFPFMAAPVQTSAAASYAITACNERQLEGINNAEVSAVGTARRVVPPRDYVVHERFVAVGRGASVAASADPVLEVRSQLFGEKYVTLSGRVVHPGGAAAGRAGESLSVQIFEGTGAERTPWTQVIPDADGRFSAKVRPGRTHLLEVSAFGRVTATREVATGAADVSAGELSIPAAAILEVSVTVGGAAGEAQVFVHPADEATRESVTGRHLGIEESCAPLLGPPHGGSPACNRLLVHKGGPVRVELPPGRFSVYGTIGLFGTIARETVMLAEGESRAVSLALERLPVLPAGALSADLHVHGGRSFDGTLPERDRVLSFLAASIDVIAATDHEVIHDYAEGLAALEAQGRLALMPGLETTGHILWMRPPGATIPRVIGHWNAWPLRREVGHRRGGAPWDELAEPGELFERLAPLFTGTPVIQLNHPWSGGLAGRDFGFPRALGLNLLRALPDADDGSSAAIFGRVPQCGPGEYIAPCETVRTRNDAFHLQEVMNGTENGSFLGHRAFWFYLLNQGILRGGTANSDSHTLVDNLLGVPRNVVFADTSVAAFEPDVFNQALRKGRIVGTNGPVIELSTIDVAGGTRTPGLEPFTPGPGSQLRIRVRAAPWIPVTELRIIVNGKVARTLTAADGLKHPETPLGTEGLLRFDGEIPLAPLLPAGLQDAWVVVEAGYPLPLHGDLNEDGVPDTGDNDGNGVVDLADVREESRDGCRPGAGSSACGPLGGHPEPKDESHPLFHFNSVIPGGYPLAFTNPLLLDRDGGGYSGPGVGGIAP